MKLALVPSPVPKSPEVKPKRSYPLFSLVQGPGANRAQIAAVKGTGNWSSTNLHSTIQRNKAHIPAEKLLQNTPTCMTCARLPDKVAEGRFVIRVALSALALCSPGHLDFWHFPVPATTTPR